MSLSVLHDYFLRHTSSINVLFHWKIINHLPLFHKWNWFSRISLHHLHCVMFQFGLDQVQARPRGTSQDKSCFWRVLSCSPTVDSLLYFFARVRGRRDWWCFEQFRLQVPYSGSDIILSNLFSVCSCVPSDWRFLYDFPLVFPGECQENILK